MEREVAEEGQTAITHYEVVQENIDLGLSLLKLQLETGRTHQIRVHMAYIGTPILGDTLYGKASTLINRQALHAYHMSFIHPISKELVEITSPVASDMKKVNEKAHRSGALT